MPKVDFISSTCTSTVVALTTAFVITTSSIDVLPLPMKNHKLKTKAPICCQLGKSIEGATITSFMPGSIADTRTPVVYGSYEEDMVICIAPNKSYCLKARIVKINKPSPSVYDSEAHGLNA